MSYKLTPEQALKQLERRPIDTAPKDGQWFLSWSRGFARATIVQWNGYGFTDGAVYYPHAYEWCSIPVWVEPSVEAPTIVELGSDEENGVRVVMMGYRLEDGTTVITRRIVTEGVKNVSH